MTNSETIEKEYNNLLFAYILVGYSEIQNYYLRLTGNPKNYNFDVAWTLIMLSCVLTLTKEASINSWIEDMWLEAEKAIVIAANPQMVEAELL